jgi:hypothetical protein
LIYYYIKVVIFKAVVQYFPSLCLVAEQLCSP